MKPSAPPKFRVGQVLRITHPWAAKIDPAPVERVIWDESWGCHMYALLGSKLLVDEASLIATDIPDLVMHPMVLAMRRELEELRPHANSWRQVWLDCKDLASVREVSKEFANDGAYGCATILAETLRRLDERSPAPHNVALYKELITRLQPFMPADYSPGLEWDALPSTVAHAFAGRQKLREAGSRLREYLEAECRLISDIPDEVYRPFLEALAEAES